MTTDTASLLMQAAESALDYMATIDERPVFPEGQALADLSKLHGPVPEGPMDGAEVIRDLARLGGPATTATTGGRYFGFVTGGSLPTALAANWLAGAWDQNAGAWVMSPIAAELETICEGWLLDLLDLPRESAAGFVTGTTMAHFSALAAARNAVLARLGWDVREQGLRTAPPIRFVASEEIHPSVLKAVNMLGFGRADIQFVRTDDQGAVQARYMPRLDETAIVLLQAGNVNSGACDPFAEIVPQARWAKAWVHVDGAFGLWARASPALKDLTKGADLADSWAVDAHKWLNVPYDNAFYICRDRMAAREALAISAPYLVRGEDRREPSQYTPELSRRARGIEIWAAIKSLGRAGLAELIDRCCAHAQTFAHELSAAGFEILNEVVMNQVVGRYRDDETTAALVEAVQREGTCWLGPTQWKGKGAFRISVSNWATTDEDVAATVAALLTAARRVG